MLAIAGVLWRWYAQNLVFYDSNSWVASAARAFRVLAILVVIPGLLLTLLDMTAYVIARTLGDTTASTSALLIPLPPSPPPEETLEGRVTDPMSPPPTIAITPSASPELLIPRFKFSPPGHDSGDEDSLGPASRLAGVGVFSAPGSAPGSPVMERKSLLNTRELERTLSEVREGQEEEAVHGDEQESVEVFGGESYALLDREESWEDAAAGMHMRRRAKPVRLAAGAS